MVLNLHQLVAPKTRPPPCLIRKSSPFKVDSYFPPHPPAQEERQSIYSSKRLVLKTLANDALPGSWPWTALAMRTRETHYDVQTTLDAQETTCFKRRPPSRRAQDKMEIRFGGGDT